MWLLHGNSPPDDIALFDVANWFLPLPIVTGVSLIRGGGKQLHALLLVTRKKLFVCM